MIERINLLPKKQRERAMAGAETHWFLLALAVAAAGMVALGAREIMQRGVLERRRSEIAAERDRLTVEQQNLTAAIGRMRALAGERAALQARVDALAVLQRERRSWSELLAGISRRVPEGLWLTSLASALPGPGDTAGLALRFQGKALSHERVSVLLGALERDEQFEEVTLISTARGTYLDREVVDFALSCRVGGGR